MPSFLFVDLYSPYWASPPAALVACKTSYEEPFWLSNTLVALSVVWKSPKLNPGSIIGSVDWYSPYWAPFPSAVLVACKTS